MCEQPLEHVQEHVPPQSSCAFVEEQLPIQEAEQLPEQLEQPVQLLLQPPEQPEQPEQLPPHEQAPEQFAEQEPPQPPEQLPYSVLLIQLPFNPP
ncbi:hypothetical protein SPFM8_00116 [Salmonella phage SPFM8]|nr:hypothetical protein SPFM8_00116 [Salmonella phage SPFM8]